MRFSIIFLIIGLVILCSSCGHRPRGRRPMTTEDSARRVAAAATEAYLIRMNQVREQLDGPGPATGTGEVIRGGRYKSDLRDDSNTVITRALDKYNAKLNLAMKDSTTSYGVLMSRFSVAADTLHKYIAATYSNSGHLLAYHSEVAIDEKHKVDYDLYFDKSKLIFFRERRTNTLEEDDQDLLSDDSYFMSGGKVLFCYRDEGQTQHKRDHMELINLARYTLRGDVTGHVAQGYEVFRHDYEALLAQPLELMVYTPPVRVPTIIEPQLDKKTPSRGPAF